MTYLDPAPLAVLALAAAAIVLLVWVVWPFWDADTLGVPVQLQPAPSPWPKLQHARLTDEVAHPVRHASSDVAPEREHAGRHTGELPLLWGDRYRQHNAATAARATGSWLEDTTDLSRYRAAAIAGEYAVTGEAEVATVGQDPRIAAPIATPMGDLFTTDWFSDDRMRVSA